MKNVLLILTMLTFWGGSLNTSFAGPRSPGYHRPPGPNRHVVRRKEVRVDVYRRDYHYHGDPHHHHDYDRGAVVAAGVAGLMVGTAVGTTAARPVKVVPAYGSVVYALPPGCVVTVYANIQYYQCGGVFHQPLMGSNGVYYKIVPRPY